MRNREREQLGNHVGHLPQDVELSAGTVAQNISRFSENATSDEIVAAARRAKAHVALTSIII